MSDFVVSRLSTCNTCPYNIEGTCILCGCEIAKKAQDPEAICPHVPKKWGADTPSKPERVSTPISLASGGSSAPAGGVCIPCQPKTR